MFSSEEEVSRAYPNGIIGNEQDGGSSSKNGTSSEQNGAANEQNGGSSSKNGTGNEQNGSSSSKRKSFEDDEESRPKKRKINGNLYCQFPNSLPLFTVLHAHLTEGNYETAVL